MCNCTKVCRLPDIETQDGRYPMPVHAQCCEDYKLIKFKRVMLGKSWFITTSEDAIGFMDDVKYDEDADQYQYEDVELTRDQFENLPEFMGF